MKEGNIPIRDFVLDTLSSIRMHGKRSLLSGSISVWGVFIFVVILGTANGINRGIKSNFDYFLEYGIIAIYPGEVSKPVNGLVRGRHLSLDMSDVNEMKLLFEDRSEGIFPRLYFNTSCNSSTGSVALQACDFRDGLDEKYISIVAGTSFSEYEHLSDRRVCLIPEIISGQLYDNIAQAIGSTLLVNGIPFIVKGVYRPVHNMPIRNLLMPFGTAMSIGGQDGRITSVEIKMYNDFPAEEKFRLKDDIHKFLCTKKKVDTDDSMAFRLEEQIDFLLSQNQFLSSFRLFADIIGIMSLLMGIISVSSITNLSVKERTSEIAIRLVCGSRVSSIFLLILGEAVITMLLFGFLGMFLAAGLLTVLTSVIEKMNESATWVLIGNLNVSWSLALQSTILIVLCGLAAGFGPARKAVSIDISDTLNE